VQDLLGILTVLEAQHSIVGVTDYKHLAPEARLHVALDPFIEYKMKVYVGQERADYPTYAKDNFCFERVISGWRGALTVLDLRLKK
jgi:hypothetical protein